MTIRAKTRIKTLDAIYRAGDALTLDNAEESRLVASGDAEYISDNGGGNNSESFGRAVNSLQAALAKMKKADLLAYGSAIGVTLQDSQTVEEIKSAIMAAASENGVDYEALPDEALLLFGKQIGISETEREKLLDAIELSLT